MGDEVDCLLVSIRYVICITNSNLHRVGDTKISMLLGVFITLYYSKKKVEVFLYRNLYVECCTKNR